MSSTALAERIEGRIDQTVMGDLAIAGSDARTPVFATMRDILEFAKVMAVSGIAVRAHLRNNPGACAAVCMQAQRWAMDPFTVGNKSYVVNDQLAFEAQLINAVVNTRAPIRGRLRTRFVGEGGKRRCIASGTFIGDDEPTEVTSPEFDRITPKNSPLWKSDPDQQMAYYTKRLWARRECPEVLLGVYDIDELAEARVPTGPDHARDVTPPARLTAADLLAQAQGTAVAPTIIHDQDGVVIDPPADALSLAIAIKPTRSGAPDWRAFQEDLAALLAAHPGRAGDIQDANQHHLDDLAKEDAVRRGSITELFVAAVSGGDSQAAA